MLDAGQNGVSTREYIWLDDMPIGVIDQVNTSSRVLYYVHADHLDRPVMMTNAAKANVWSALWSPFGAAQSITGSLTMNGRFPGQWFQIESGLHWNWHRHYDPSTGGYLQADPLGLAAMLADGPGVYGYARQSPLVYQDMLGTETTVIINNNFGGYHAGLFIGHRSGSSDNNRIYDPAGSFGGRDHGSNDILYGNVANYDNYLSYQKGDGPNITTCTFDTSPETESELSDAIEQNGGCPIGGLCAKCLTNAIRGIGPFGKLGAYFLPSSLGKAVRKLPGAMRNK